MSAMQGVLALGLARQMPALASTVDSYSKTYEQNRHRLYSLAFWMTDHELAAEQVMISTFTRCFAANATPIAEDLDRALLAELRELMPIGNLTLHCIPADKTLRVRYNIKRTELEHAVVQLPATERLIFLMHDVEQYEHARIARTLGLSELESRAGLHQARLRMRELLAR